MANRGVVISIAGITVRQPSSLGFESYNLTKSGRVASGKMTGEIIAKKRKFTFSYDIMSGRELDTIKSAIDGDNFFFEFRYYENDVEKSAIVYSGAIKRDRWRTDAGWYWKNVTFDLIEQ